MDAKTSTSSCLGFTFYFVVVGVVVVIVRIDVCQIKAFY
jgi:hypothetical protein